MLKDSFCPVGELKFSFFAVFESCFGIYGFVLFLLSVREPIKMNSLVCQCQFQDQKVPYMMNLCSYCQLMNSNVQHSQRISSHTSSNCLVNLTKWCPFLTLFRFSQHKNILPAEITSSAKFKWAISDCIWFWVIFPACGSSVNNLLKFWSISPGSCVSVSQIYCNVQSVCLSGTICFTSPKTL